MWGGGGACHGANGKVATVMDLAPKNYGVQGGNDGHLDASVSWVSAGNMLQHQDYNLAPGIVDYG